MLPWKWRPPTLGPGNGLPYVLRAVPPLVSWAGAQREIQSLANAGAYESQPEASEGSPFSFQNNGVQDGGSPNLRLLRSEAYHEEHFEGLEKFLPVLASVLWQALEME